MYSIGQLYEQGQGVPADRQQAILWYRKGANLENDDCKKRLADLIPQTQPTTHPD
jgi:TPR repeat protein